MERLFPRGHSFPDRGLDESAVEDKFFRLSRGVFAKSVADGIRSDVMALERAGAVGALMDKLSRVKHA